MTTEPSGRRVRHPMNPDQLGRLIDQHSATLELYARLLCDSAEDVVQEAFVKLAGLSKQPDRTEAWLFRVVRNAALNASKARLRRQRHEALAARSNPAWFEPGWSRGKSEEIDGEAAQAALMQLPLEQREVVVAHLWGGLRFDEIGSMLGLSTSSAHRQYQAGLVALREALGVKWTARTTASSDPIR